MIDFIDGCFASTLTPVERAYLHTLRSEPLADERGRELLARVCLAAGRQRSPLDNDSRGPELAARLLTATRAQLRAGSHVSTPSRVLQGAPGGTLFAAQWSSEAEACAWRGAGIFLDFILGVLIAFEGRLPAGWGEPWHWLLEPGEVAPTAREARYNLVSGRMVISGAPLTAEQALDDVRRWKGLRTVHAELDLEASIALARRRTSHG